MAMQWTAWATLVSLVVYMWMLANVGKARGKFKIPAPATDGPVEFLSVLRVQANTVEQMVIYFPALWMCAYFYSDRLAAVGGALWAIGRIIYALGYYAEPGKRTLGFTITSFASFALLVGTVIGLFTH